ncbi:hypothetical protein BSL88_16770, partial [Acinetobacter baylyi]|uniref:hypothetical protein n=1 Tax=Acinetobacter baylyi TaxID=202950 RepID=UPI001C097488
LTEFNYNTAVHSSSQITPFEAVYGRPPPSLLPYDKGDSVVHEVDRLLHERDEMLKKMKASLQRAQQRM